MTRTEAIATALRDELRVMATELNASATLRAITFEIKLIPGTAKVRAVIVRPEFERIPGNGTGG
jgi:hypothetical protein